MSVELYYALHMLLTLIVELRKQLDVRRMLYSFCMLIIQYYWKGCLADVRDASND